MATNPSNKFFLLLISAIIITTGYVGCSKSNDASNNGGNTNLSAADKIAGVYTGPSKYLPDNIFLGNYAGCVVPTDWQSNFQTGNSTATVSKVSDSTVTISLTGVFPTTTYTPVLVTLNGSVATCGLGSFDINAKSMTVSGRTVRSRGYLLSNACLGGLPYYSGYDGLINGTYSYYTIDHVDFTGTM